jgi:putative ABC transport system permease protein
VFGLLGQILGTRGVEVVTSFPMVEHLRIGLAAGTVGVVTAASLLAVVLPGYVVARVRPSFGD